MKQRVYKVPPVLLPTQVLSKGKCLGNVPLKPRVAGGAQCITPTANGLYMNIILQHVYYRLYLGWQTTRAIKRVVIFVLLPSPFFVYKRFLLSQILRICFFCYLSF